MIILAYLKAAPVKHNLAAETHRLTHAAKRPVGDCTVVQVADVVEGAKDAELQECQDRDE